MPGASTWRSASRSPRSGSTSDAALRAAPQGEAVDDSILGNSALGQQASDRPAGRGDDGGDQRQRNQGVDVVQPAEEIAQESDRDLRRRAGTLGVFPSP